MMKEQTCDTMYNDPEYRRRMEELQQYDYELMGELWQEEQEDVEG